MSLDAAGTTDPDGDGLNFAWSVYPATSDSLRKVAIDGRDTRRPKITIAPGLAGQMIPILITATDQGDPRLTRYGRVLLVVEDGE